ncbi:hypothetical protein AURDEDRAFT_160865 [Auricularia subglabra TFB-10046 SS5]|nr:hypothetical protein AURDEDRAFT_160865 [Auricularia subglabra TFB-10046 SS5]
MLHASPEGKTHVDEEEGGRAPEAPGGQTKRVLLPNAPGPTNAMPTDAPRPSALGQPPVGCVQRLLRIVSRACVVARSSDFDPR